MCFELILHRTRCETRRQVVLHEGPPTFDFDIWHPFETPGSCRHSVYQGDTPDGDVGPDEQGFCLRHGRCCTLERFHVCDWFSVIGYLKCQGRFAKLHVRLDPYEDGHILNRYFAAAVAADPNTRQQDVDEDVAQAIHACRTRYFNAGAEVAGFCRTLRPHEMGNVRGHDLAHFLGLYAPYLLMTWNKESRALHDWAAQLYDVSISPSRAMSRHVAMFPTWLELLRIRGRGRDWPWKVDRIPGSPGWSEISSIRTESDDIYDPPHQGSVGNAHQDLSPAQTSSSYSSPSNRPPSPMLHGNASRTSSWDLSPSHFPRSPTFTGEPVQSSRPAAHSLYGQSPSLAANQTLQSSQSRPEPAYSAASAMVDPWLLQPSLSDTSSPYCPVSTPPMVEASRSSPWELVHGYNQLSPIRESLPPPGVYSPEALHEPLNYQSPDYWPTSPQISPQEADKDEVDFYNSLLASLASPPHTNPLQQAGAAYQPSSTFPSPQQPGNPGPSGENDDTMPNNDLYSQWTHVTSNEDEPVHAALSDSDRGEPVYVTLSDTDDERNEEDRPVQGFSDAPLVTEINTDLSLLPRPWAPPEDTLERRAARQAAGLYFWNNHYDEAQYLSNIGPLPTPMMQHLQPPAPTQPYFYPQEFSSPAYTPLQHQEGMNIPPPGGFQNSPNNLEGFVHRSMESTRLRPEIVRPVPTSDRLMQAALPTIPDLFTREDMGWESEYRQENNSRHSSVQPPGSSAGESIFGSLRPSLLPPAEIVPFEARSNRQTNSSFSSHTSGRGREPLRRKRSCEELDGEPELSPSKRRLDLWT